MTREEAIEYFKFHRKIFCEDYLKICPKDSIAYQATLKEKEFYDMAIQALEQEPTTKNDLGVDCISRADAIKGLGEQPYVWTDSDFEIQQLADWKNHKEMLENLPSVTPQEPRKGHWILADDQDNVDTDNGNYRYICSECTFSDIHAKSTEVPYCWHCGADMRADRSEVENGND